MRVLMPAVLVLAGTVPASQRPQLDLQPIPDPEHCVHVTAPAIGATWRLRLPERILADPVVLLIDHHDAQVTWNGSSTAGFSAAASKAPITFRANMEPAENGLALALTIENHGRETLRNVVGHVCLSHDRIERAGAERFADPSHDRTYIVTDQGLVNIDSVDRGGTPDGIRTHYLVAGASPISFFPTQPFWGKLSKVHATEPWIAGASVSGSWTVALWWEKAVELFQNSDASNRCIHSDPAFGDLAPAQSVTVRGGLDLVHGSPADALRGYRRERSTLH